MMDRELPQDRELRRWLKTVFDRREELTGAVAAVADSGGLRLWASCSQDDTSRGVGIGLDSLFDLASLAKPFTATLALEMDRGGGPDLGTRVGDVYPDARRALANRRVEDLLRHRAGFVPWAPWERLGATPAEVARRLIEDPRWAGAPRGTYSDLGPFVALRMIEACTGEKASDLLRRHVLHPHGLEEDIRIAPVGGEGLDLVACVLGDEKERELARNLGYDLPPSGEPRPGQPQDANARWVASGGGFAGHAGLFGSTRGVLELGRLWLRAEGCPDVVQRSRALRGGGRYALGWWRRRVQGSAGRALSAEAFGHVGFTGGSLWVDPGHDAVLVLLAHRSSVQPGLEKVRQEFHRLFVPRRRAMPPGRP